MALAQQAAFARLVFEHARRLLQAHAPDLGAVELACPGLGGLDQTRTLDTPGGGRELLLLGQMDSYASGLAEALEAGAVVCLAGVQAALLWRPGLVSPGWNGQATLQLLPALLAVLLGMDLPAAQRDTIPPGLFLTAN